MTGCPGTCYLHQHLGVSLNGGTPISHPKMIIFSRKKPMVVGYQYFWKPPFITGVLGGAHLATPVVSLACFDGKNAKAQHPRKSRSFAEFLGRFWQGGFLSPRSKKTRLDTFHSI